RVDRGDESATRAEEGSEACGGDDRESPGRGAIQQTGKSGFETSRGGSRLAGDRRFRVADFAGREPARRENPAPTGRFASRPGRQRSGGRDLQSDQRDQSARCRSAPARQRRVGPRLDEKRRLDRSAELSRFDQGQRGGDLARTAKPDEVEWRITQPTNRGNLC